MIKKFESLNLGNFCNVIIGAPIYIWASPLPAEFWLLVWVPSIISSWPFPYRFFTFILATSSSTFLFFFREVLPVFLTSIKFKKNLFAEVEIQKMCSRVSQKLKEKWRRIWMLHLQNQIETEGLNGPESRNGA